MNPDEYLNCDLKDGVHSRPPARSKGDLKRETIAHLKRVQKLLGRVKSYFQHPKITYAAQNAYLIAGSIVGLNYSNEYCDNRFATKSAERMLHPPDLTGWMALSTASRAKMVVVKDHTINRSHP